MYTTIGTILFFLDDCLLSWLDNQDNKQSYKKKNMYQMVLVVQPGQQTVI